jgi:hypothetical protein
MRKILFAAAIIAALFLFPVEAKAQTVCFGSQCGGGSGGTIGPGVATLCDPNSGIWTDAGSSLVCNGALPVPQGGTGVTSFNAYGPIFGGTSAGGSLQSVSVGTATHVLTSNGAGALPTFQAIPGATITEGVTATSGFTTGEAIYSSSNLVQGLQLQALLLGNTCTSAVGSDAYACSAPSPQVCPSSLATSPPVFLTTDVANTGAATFAYCGLTAKAIVWPSPTASVALVTGDMIAATSYLLVYNATGDNWKLVSNSANTPSRAGTNSWTGANTWNSSLDIFATGSRLFFGGANNNSGILVFDTNHTPDAFAIGAGATSGSIHFMESADTQLNANNGACGTSACTEPNLIFHPGVLDSTQYNAISVTGRAGGSIKTLTETTATSLVRIPVAAGVGTGGEFCYTTQAYDATDQQVRSACIRFTVSNKAGTETCSLVGVAGTTDASISETEDGSGSGAISTGTLTTAVTCDVTPTNAVDIQMAATSSLTQTTLQAVWYINLVGPGQPARQ